MRPRSLAAIFRTGPLVLAGAFGLLGIGCAAPDPGEPGETILRGGRLFDGVSDTLKPNTGIVVRGGRFVEVGTSLAGRDLEGAEVVDLDDDDTVLPGFFDLHAHYGMTLVGPGRVDECVYNPLIYLANGVTATFPAGSMDPDDMLEVRDRIERGEQVGPRILSSGPYFGFARPGWNDEITLDELRTEVDAWAARGIKAKGLTPEQMRVVIDQAHLHGLTVTSHLYNDANYVNTVPVREAISMGIDRLEHYLVEPARLIDGSVAPGDPEFSANLQLFLDNEVYFDATVSVYATFGADPDPALFDDDWADERRFFTPHTNELAAQRAEGSQTYRRLYEMKRESVRLFHEAGGARLLTAGSDHPGWGRFTGGFSYHRELLALVLSGVPPPVVLKAATTNGARAMGMDDRLGTIEPGKLADLVVVQGNPLEDIRNARRVMVVMKDGRAYDPVALLSEAEGKIGPAAPDERVAWGRDADHGCLARGL